MCNSYSKLSRTLCSCKAQQCKHQLHSTVWTVGEVCPHQSHSHNCLKTGFSKHCAVESQPQERGHLGWSGSTLLKHISTHGVQAGGLAFVDSAVRCDMGRRRGQGGEDPEPVSDRLGFLRIYSQPASDPTCSFQKCSLVIYVGSRTRHAAPLFHIFMFAFILCSVHSLLRKVSYTNTYTCSVSAASSSCLLSGSSSVYASLLSSP